jgi:hypothetical protein
MPRKVDVEVTSVDSWDSSERIARVHIYMLCFHLANLLHIAYIYCAGK